VAVTVALVTGLYGPRNRLNVHLVAGATICVLILFRLVWGALGSAYARFSNFPIGWSAVTDDLVDLASGRRRRHLGHNPLGSLMVIALLAVLTLILLTGVVTLGGVDKQGPLAFATSYAMGKAAREAHQILAYALLAMIAGHLLGVVYEVLHGDVSLVTAMFTGRKPLEGAVAGAGVATARPFAAGLTIALVLAIGARGVATLASRPAYGAPADSLDPTYAKECGSCHFAYPPSLAPRARWQAVMDGLGDHFGEDATLDPTTARAIGAYLSDNSAERWDTRAAHEFARENPRDPLRLTATPFWVRMHRHIDPAVFKSRAVGAKGACAACHSDAATGRFDPQAIQIPEPAPS
jgi:cytochrome b